MQEIVSWKLAETNVTTLRRPAGDRVKDREWVKRSSVGFVSY